MTTDRRAHWASPARDDRQPARLVALAVATEGTPLATDRSLCRHVLIAWAHRGWERDHHGRTRHHEGGGVDTRDLWRALDHVLARPGLTWVVTDSAAWVATLIGLWERIDRGELYLEGSDHHDRDPSAAGREGRGLGLCILEDPPTVIRWRARGKQGTVQWCDRRNWFPAPVESAGGVQAEARALAGAMERMVDVLRTENWGGLRLTAAAQSAHTWSHRYIRDLVRVHTDPDALSLERDCLYGGRCEARRLGTVPGPVYELDFRSQYGAICAEEHLPVLLDCCGTGTVPALAGTAGLDTLALADVTVESGAPDYPLRRGGLTVWPIGRYRTCLAGPELADAVTRGRVVRWHRWATYQGHPALRAYALAVWGRLARARQEGDKPLEGWLKSMLVCLPGKLAQRDWRWEPAPWCREPPPWGRWYERDRSGETRECRAVAGHVQAQAGGEYTRRAMPAVAAWITSEGRIRLLRVLRALEWSDVYYYDTDSVLVSERGYLALVAAGMVGAGSLGDLRLVRRYSRCEIAGWKAIALDGDTRCAGVPKGPRSISDLGGQYWTTGHLAGALRSGAAPVADLRLRACVRSGEYRHGRVGPGGLVSPFVLWEDL